MSFTKWFAIMDYVASLGFKTTELGTDIKSVTNSKLLSGPLTVGLAAIRSSDNGKSITHAMGWDMQVQITYNKTSMLNIISSSGYNSAIRGTLPTIPQSPNIRNLGSMASSYSELGSRPDLQSSIMFALGEWFDGVQAQVSTPSVFKSIDFTDTKGKGVGALTKPLKLITPFENAFDNLGLSKKLLKQLVDSGSGLLAQSNNPSLSRRSGGAELWLFNTPYIFAHQLAKGQGKARGDSDRDKILKYFYNQGSILQDYNDVAKASKYSGPRPFRYFGYPQTSILYATKEPKAALSTITGQVNLPVSIQDYKYSNNGSAPQWQTISDPIAIITFTDKIATPLWIIRSLSQYGSAKKVSSRMRVAKVATSTGAKPVVFPSLISATQPDYTQLGFFAAGQNSPAEFESILTAVVNDPSPTMATQLGATPTRGAAAAPGKKAKPIASAPLTASKGAKPSPPKRNFSPDGVKVTITDFTKSDTFPMATSWLVLNITPDQAIYNKIMKDWEKSMKGNMKAKKKVTPPTNYIKQYPKIVQLAFKAGTTLLINTNGISKPEWKEYKWDRDKDVVTVSKDSRFTFIDNDPLKGLSFALRTSLGTIDIKMTYDEAPHLTDKTTVGHWFKEGSTEMKVEVGLAKGSMMLPINVMTAPSPDVSPHSLIDTNLAVDWYQRTLLLYPPKELITDEYPDAWTVFGSEIEIAYFNADSLAKKLPLLFQAIPFDQSTAKEIDITKEYIELELFVENNTDTYTGFNYVTGEFTSEKIVFPCDERYLALQSITTDPSTGEITTELIQPAKVSRGKSISTIWISKEGDQAKIEFKSGETIIMPDEVNRGFSAIENGNQQELTGLITQLNVNKFRKGSSAADLPNEMRSLRTVKNIPVTFLNRMTYEDSAGDEILAGTGGLIYEDVDGNVNIILPNPDPDLGLVKFKLIWKGA